MTGMNTSTENRLYGGFEFDRMTPAQVQLLRWVYATNTSLIDIGYQNPALNALRPTYRVSSRTWARLRNLGLVETGYAFSVYLTRLGEEWISRDLSPGEHHRNPVNKYRPARMHTRV